MMNTTKADPHALATGAPAPSGLRLTLAHWLEAGILPLGLLVLLTGMLWAEERPEYHTLFYTLVAFPAFVLLLLKRDARDALLHSPIFLAFCAFAAYAMLSIAWSDTDKTLGGLLKRPLYVLLLFAAATQVALARPQRLEQVLRLATAIAAVVGAVSLWLFLNEDSDRFEGYRALSNPILTAHVFGFFLALCLAAWIVEGNRGLPGKAIACALIGAVIVATGSRGGMAAAGVAVVWAAALAGNRRGFTACALLLAAALAVVVALPELFTQRGLSLRPELWAQTLREVAQRPWLGYGYDAYIWLQIPGVETRFPNPHNMLLAVLRQEGIVGLVLWMAMYAVALVGSWRQRHDPLVLICSTTVVSGLAASIPEGISYLSRPKEHWFLIWIPFSLLAAALILNKTKNTHRP